jgi:hypothetical protein
MVKWMMKKMGYLFGNAGLSILFGAPSSREIGCPAAGVCWCAKSSGVAGSSHLCFSTIGGFHKWGTPSSLDGLFHGKSKN